MLALPLWELLAALAAVSVGAGFLGALLGLGGGLVIVPFLVLVLDIDVRLAIAASLVSVLATSAGSARRYTREGMVHLRLGMFLEVATVIGGLFGAYLTTEVLTGATGQEVLVLAFVPVTLSTAYLMLRGAGQHVSAGAERSPLADRLQLRGEYTDASTGEVRRWHAIHPGQGLALAACAGVISGLLGVGGGIFKVPAMNSFMRVPVKVASATSSLMIGVTAAAGALVFLFQGLVAPLLVAPIALGIIVGSYGGSVAQSRFTPYTLKRVFAVVLVVAAVSMLLRGLGVYSG